jgi:hypothetical protein
MSTLHILWFFIGLVLCSSMIAVAIPLGIKGKRGTTKEQLIKYGWVGAVAGVALFILYLLFIYGLHMYHINMVHAHHLS